MFNLIDAIHNVNEYMTDKTSKDLSDNSMLFIAIVKIISKEQRR